MSDKRRQKILERIQELASISETEQGITRTFGSAAFRKAAGRVLSWMKDAGLEAWFDNIGNVRGRWNCAEQNARTLVIASHIDTVINAGRFDGPLGVLMGLDLVEQLILFKTELPFHIELIAFSDEEGVRFHTTYLGSKVVAGCFDEDLLEKRDSAGISVRDLIDEMGGDAADLKNDAIKPADWLGYFEIHIEQGPVLYEKNIPVALVTAIAGQKRVALRFRGEAGHAGTVPMFMRKDALCCASEFILAAERMALENQDRLMATVGKIDVVNAASNVIPGEVLCTLDLRSEDAAFLESSHEKLQAICQAVCNNRNIVVEWNLVQQSAPVICDQGLNRALASSIREAGYEEVSLVSGAGHDGVPVSAIAPVCMLFVRCYKGISHHPLENVEARDLEAAMVVAEGSIRHLKKNKIQ